MSRKVTIKHGKKKHKNVMIEEDDTLDDFQAKLFSLTQVPMDRQKIICKGRNIECDEDLASIPKKAVVLLMGSAEQTNIDRERVNFVEDMTEAQKQEALAELPPGLHNLGNTCYLNSTLQCLKGIPELKTALKQHGAAPSGYPSVSQQLGKLFVEMDSTSEPVIPRDFVTTFRSAYPQFAEKTEQGIWRQQDADECLTEILSVMKREMKLGDTGDANWVDNCFGGEFDVVTNCEEEKDEAPTHEKDRFVKLRCFIDTETRHINDGIKKDLEQTIEKTSATSGLPRIYKVNRSISKLPKYLNVQLVRFFWKQSKQKNAKILRKVVFPEKLDVYEFCNQNLKDGIGKYRKAKLEKENKAQDKTDEEKGPDAMDVDIEGDNTGYYELVGLVTHKGLSANSGHYIGYSKLPNRGWLKFDDDVVSEVSSDDIKNLYGGGHWQMAYECFYQRIEPEN